MRTGVDVRGIRPQCVLSWSRGVSRRASPPVSRFWLEKAIRLFLQCACRVHPAHKDVTVTHAADTSSPAPALTVLEVAERLAISRALAYRLVKRGAIPAARIGGVWRIDARALESMFATPPQTAVRA